MIEQKKKNHGHHILRRSMNTGIHQSILADPTMLWNAKAPQGIGEEVAGSPVVV